MPLVTQQSSSRCLTKPEDVRVSGPLLNMEGVPASSVALPPNVRRPVSLSAHSQRWKYETIKRSDWELLAARIPGRPGF